MWKCSDCGSGYLDPRPSQDTIHIAYESYYTHEEFAKPGATDNAKPVSGISAILRTLANGYRNRRYGTSFEDSHWLGYWILKYFPPSRELVDVQFRHLPKAGSTGTARLLDVGCGDGSFLQLARAAGWTVFGCDPDPAAVENALARDIEVRVGGADAWLDEEGSFDAISLSHVLEHVPDPAATLGALNRLLKPRGFLYIDTPHIDALGHQLYGKFWHGLDVPRHLSILSLKAMHELLRNNGMGEIEYRRRTREFKVLGRKSAHLKAGLSPYLEKTENPLDLPTKADRLRAWLASDRSESITVICRKT